MTTTREYRVKPVTRYIVTEWAEDIGRGGRVTNTRCMGEFANPDQAGEVASALAIANGGYVERADAPGLNEGHAIFTGLPAYRTDDGEVAETTPSPFA